MIRRMIRSRSGISIRTIIGNNNSLHTIAFAIVIVIVVASAAVMCTITTSTITINPAIDVFITSITAIFALLLLLLLLSQTPAAWVPKPHTYR